MNHTQLFIFAPILFLVFFGIMSASPDVFSLSIAPGQNLVTIVQGTSTPGCEANNSCHSPYRIEIGDKEFSTTLQWLIDNGIIKI